MNALAVLLLLFAAILLIWPGRKLLIWHRRRGATTRRIRREDALKHLCQAESAGQHPTLHSLAGILQIKPAAAALLLHDLETHGLATVASGDWRLTPAGRQRGAEVIRAHRLWEFHLAENTGVHESAWHAQAERREHQLSPGETDALAHRLGHPTHDPHGDAIPAAGEFLVGESARPLNTLAPGETGRIAHIEDEPASLYAQIAAQKLRPGMKFTVEQKDHQHLQLRVGRTAHVLSPLLAQQIEVLPLPGDESAAAVPTLADFSPGAEVRVLALARHARGPERRRLLDLGFVPGTLVSVELTSPSGEPTAYRVRETLIALHHEQAALIQVEPAISAAV